MKPNYRNNEVVLPEESMAALMNYFNNCSPIEPKPDDCLPIPTPEPTEFVYSPQPGEPGFPEP